MYIINGLWESVFIALSVCERNTKAAQCKLRSVAMRWAISVVLVCQGPLTTCLSLSPSLSFQMVFICLFLCEYLRRDEPASTPTICSSGGGMKLQSEGYIFSGMCISPQTAYL